GPAPAGSEALVEEAHLLAHSIIIPRKRKFRLVDIRMVNAGPHPLAAGAASLPPPWPRGRVGEGAGINYCLLDQPLTPRTGTGWRGWVAPPGRAWGAPPGR